MFVRVVSSGEIQAHPLHSLCATAYMPAAEKAQLQKKLAATKKTLDRLNSRVRNMEQRIAELDKILAGDPKIGGG